jgi:hypothetical protein
MQQAADEATEVIRLEADELKVRKQQPLKPLFLMAKGTPPLKQIPRYTLLNDCVVLQR